MRKVKKKKKKNTECVLTCSSKSVEKPLFVVTPL